VARGATSCRIVGSLGGSYLVLVMEPLAQASSVPTEPTAQLPMLRGRGAFAVMAAMVLGALFLGMQLARVVPRRAARLPSLGVIPGFEMENQTGAAVTSAGLRGKVLIVDFFYATCPTSCPRLNAQMSELGRLLKARSRDLPVHLVSITLDPANDTPEVLGKYAAGFGASPSDWSFLSGRDADLNRVVTKGFKVFFERTEDLGLGTIMHGEWFVLVDKQGQIRGYYQIGDAERMDELVNDAAALAEENGTPS